MALSSNGKSKSNSNSKNKKSHHNHNGFTVLGFRDPKLQIPSGAVDTN